MLIKRKTIFDVLSEAEDDNAGGDDTTTDAGAGEAPAPEDSGEDTGGEDDNFDIDTNLDDEGGGEDTGGDNMGGDDLGGDDDTTSDTSSSDLGGDGGGDEEPVKANTDIFASLSAEEQKMKIVELKNLFGELYSSIDDLLERINDTNTDESNIEVISKITSTLYSLKQYMRDYIIHIFPTKSYYENDVTFNRFLAMINGISVTIEEIGAIKIANKKNHQ